MMSFPSCLVKSSVPLHHLLHEAIWDHLRRLATRHPRSRFCRPARGRRCDACGGRLQGLSPPADVQGLPDLPWVPRVMPSLRLGPRHRHCLAAALGLDIVVRGSMNEHLICHDCRPRIDLRRDHSLLMQKNEISHPLPYVTAHLSWHEEHRPPRVDGAFRPGRQRWRPRPWLMNTIAPKSTMVRTITWGVILAPSGGRSCPPILSPRCAKRACPWIRWSAAARAAVGPLGTVCRPTNRLSRNGVLRRPSTCPSVERQLSCPVV
jgi:hypothetical protein